MGGRWRVGQHAVDCPPRRKTATCLAPRFLRNETLFLPTVCHPLRAANRVQKQMIATPALNRLIAEMRTSFADLCRRRGYTIAWNDARPVAINFCVEIRLRPPIDASAIMQLSTSFADDVRREVPQPCALLCSLKEYMIGDDYRVRLEVSLA